MKENQIQPHQQNNLETYKAVFENAIALTAKELGYTISIKQLNTLPEFLPEQDQQAVKMFEFTMYQYAKNEMTDFEEQVRTTRAFINEQEQARMILWSRVESHQDVIELGKQKISNMEDNSTKRQIDAFYNSHYDSVKKAGVEPAAVAELMARPDKFIVNTSRAIARVEKADLTQEEKNGKIAEILEDAITLQYASDIRKKHLNGKVKIPRDILWLEDGTRLVTFICDDDEAFLELDKHTGNLTAEHGNVEPILLATKDERIKNDVLTQLTIALAIIESGDEDLSLVDKDVLEILKKYNYIERKN